MGSATSSTFLERQASSAGASPDSGDLPCPVMYQDLQKEASRILKQTDCQGLHFILVNKLNEKFIIAHKFAMESLEDRRIPTLKVSTGDYEFGSFYDNPKLLIAGKINKCGSVKACVKYNFTNNFSCDINAKLMNEPHCSHGVFQFDYKGKDYWSQFQFGNKGLYGANYIQSVNPNLSLGTQLLWRGDQTKSIIDFAARYSANKMVASGRVSSDGSISWSYVQKFSEKVSLASEFKYAPSTRDVISSFGYEYKFRECLLKGKVDCNAVISSYYERNIGSGARLLLFAQIDHVKESYKYGFGLEVVRGKPTIANFMHYCMKLLAERISL